MEEKLIEILKRYSLEDVIKIEESDRQFLALKRLYEGMKNKDYFLYLVISNSLLSYQLSSKWEDYWEEFSHFAMEYNFWDNFNFIKVKQFFMHFLPNSRWNKRLLNMKIHRIEKIMLFLEKFVENQEFYYENQTVFLFDLAKIMKQKTDDKTIVFCVKMFSYWARIYFKKFILSPFEINIPLDSRILKLTKIYNDKWLLPSDFWQKISKEVSIPLIHLDALLWIKCSDLVCYSKY